MKFLINLLMATMMTVSPVMSFAAQIKGQKESSFTGKDFERLQVPGNSVSKLADKQFLIETGQKNMLANHSFEAVQPTSTTLTGWTLGSWAGTPFTSTAATTNVTDGAKSARITLPTMNSNNVILSQTVTDTRNLKGQSIEVGIKLTPVSLTDITNAFVRVCITFGSDLYCPPENVQWSKLTVGVPSYIVLNYPGMDGSVGNRDYTISIEGGGTVGANPAMVFDVDGAYMGPATNIGTYTQPITFTAKISATGVVTDQTPTGTTWISGNATVSATDLFAIPFTSGFFTSIPNCTATITSGAGTAQGIRTFNQATTGISVQSGNTVPSAQPFVISCTKTGSDAPQTVIRQENADYAPRPYTPTFTGFGTPTNVECTEAREGAFNIIECKFTSGTTTGVEARVSLPYDRVTPVFTQGIRQAGRPWSFSANTGSVTSPLMESSTGYLTFGASSASAAGLTKINASAYVSSGQTVSFQAQVPIAGWEATQGAVLLPNSVFVGSAIVDTADNASYASGTYSPTWTNLTNITSLSVGVTWWYLRIGSNLFIGGPADVTPTAANTPTEAYFSLPAITFNNFSNNVQCTGGNNNYGIINERRGPMASVSGDKKIRMRFTSGSSTTADTQIINAFCKLQ